MKHVLEKQNHLVEGDSDLVSKILVIGFWEKLVYTVRCSSSFSSSCLWSEGIRKLSALNKLWIFYARDKTK